MPVDYMRLDKGGHKKKLKLSIIKKVASEDKADSRADDVPAHEECGESAVTGKSLWLKFPVGRKRPLRDSLQQASNAVKKHKLTYQDDTEEPEELWCGAPWLSAGSAEAAAMLNGYHGESTSGRKPCDSARPPIATLSNLGNTCFLNSVLYTLRFTPNFLHNLHHLVGGLALAEQRQPAPCSQAKAKSSSLGRNFANLASSGARSWSSKDLLSLGGDAQAVKSKIQVTTEKMHEMYACLRACECRDSCEPYQAETFLAALRNVNSIFEGNQQQDAHELLMCLLDSIRETCRELRARLTLHQDLANGSASSEQAAVENDPAMLVCSKPSLGILRKSWKNRKKPKNSKLDSPTKENSAKSPPAEEECLPASNDWGKNLGYDFVAEDFEGTTVLRTTCLECEIVTERKQTMCDISVPIPEDRRLESDAMTEPSMIYQQACVTSEYLRDQNKYWCDECVRYNEARRSVTYETLPRLLVLQLKRFSGGMEKLTAHMPTPLTLACFCDTCCPLPTGERPHRYMLYAVIMHLGQTLTGGHYIAYTRAYNADNQATYLCCERDNKSCLVVNSAEKPNFMKNLFARNKNNGVTDKIPPIKRRTPLVVPPANNQASAPVVAQNGSNNGSSVCSSMDCCGVKLGRGLWAADELSTSPDQDVWLMCDDETVKPISNEEFDELLSSKPKIRSASTPYLLFYVRTDIE